MKQILKQLLLSWAVLFIPNIALAEENDVINKAMKKMLNINEIPQIIANTSLMKDKIPSPHWENDACNVCHLEQGKPTQKNLRINNIDKVCSSCHDANFDHSYIHPIDVKPSNRMLKKMNKQYKDILKKSSGRLGCVTCHDIALQCQAEKSHQKLTNPKFFRLGPFDSRSQPCYFCHDNGQYTRLNPHDQLDDQGKIKKKKCRICHAGSIEKLLDAKSIKEVEFHAAKDNLASMCWGCHVWTPHPGGQFSFFKKKSGPNHLIKPPDYIYNSLKESEKKYKVSFPLEPETGKIFCGTCHNPHEKGVVKNRYADKGADAKRRLRTKNICAFCHKK